MSVFEKLANKILPPVDEEADRELDRLMTEKLAAQEEEIAVFLASELYDRVQALCEQKEMTEDELIAKALDALDV